MEHVDIRFVVEANYQGWRLDKYLCDKIRRLSRTQVQTLIEQSLISTKKLKASSRVSRGLIFHLRKQVTEEPDTPDQVREVHLDEWLIVLDKPAGLPMHPTARYFRGTLVTLLKLKYPLWQVNPAHRLDRETSGLVLCARTTEVSRKLMRAFASGEVHKEYLALCEGHPPDDRFEVDAPIAEGGKIIRVAVRIDAQFGKPARTLFEVVARFKRRGEYFSWLRAFPQTGRQHQIRVHLREAGFPLVGDKIYGPDEMYFDRFSRQCLEPEAWDRLRLPRHGLHAAAIELIHPGTQRKVRFNSPLPDDLRQFYEVREPNVEGAPLAEFAFDPDPVTMELGEMSGNR